MIIKINDKYKSYKISDIYFMSKNHRFINEWINKL